MDQETEPPKNPTTPPPDLSGPSPLAEPTLARAPDLRPPDLSAPAVRAPDLPTPSISTPAPSITASPSFSPPPTIAIPEEAKKKPKVVAPDPDEVKPGDLASFNSRIVGGVIDYAVVICVIIVLSFILPNFMGSLISLLGLGYILTKDSLPFLDGQSIGKKVMKIRAVTAEGQPLTNDWKTGILRNAFLVIAPVELVVLLLREEKPEKGRRLGDDFAKTKVIVVGDPVAPDSPEI